MSLKILVDMNLSPEWAGKLNELGGESVHWPAVGNPKARDAELMQWARTHEHAVFTHDLDFGAMLALSHDAGPSVVQIRGRHVLPENALPLVAASLRRYQEELLSGALVVIEEARSRVRVLPL